MLNIVWFSNDFRSIVYSGVYWQRYKIMAVSSIRYL